MQTTINFQSALSAIIKRKAVGPKGSRHLNEDDLQIIIPALEAEEVNLVSKAVLVASVMILEQNELEKRLLKQWNSQELLLPDALRELFFEQSNSDFHLILKKILHGNNLSATEASVAVSYLWDNDIPDYQKGVFLIGERLKRENFAENHAFLHAMRQKANTCEVNVRLLVDLSDPYDGFRRYPVYTVFVASLLGAMGFPAYCHGVRKVAPKNGDTIHKILRLAGKNPLNSMHAAIKDIEDKDIGWGYVDQSIYFPAMSDLLELRQKIVKRVFLATLEKLLQPLRSAGSNFLVTGFVHSHYKRELARLLKDQSARDTALIVKGMEGATQVDFRKRPETVIVQNGHSFPGEIGVDQINYPREEWEQCRSLAEYCVETGVAALEGKKNVARKILINQAVQIIGGLRLSGISEVRTQVKEALDSGQALRHWQNGGS